MEMSIRGYAKRRGVSDTAVRKAIASGRITTTKSGKINPQLADRQWQSNTDPAQIRQPRDETPTGMPESSISGSSGISYQQSRAIRETYEARLKKLEFEEKSGRLISTEMVQKEAFNAARRTRDMLLNVPDKIVPLLIGRTDIYEMKSILKEELLRTLTDLANLFDGNRD